MLEIVLLMFIALSPLFEIDKFFESLMNSKLRITGTAIRPWVPWLTLQMVLIGPIVEELFFRGLILKNFLKKYTPAYAILLSSLLFGVHHIDKFVGPHHASYYTIFFYIVTGIIYGILYYTTNSLIISSLAHILWNALSLFYYDYINLNITNLILYSIIYTAALGLSVYLLRKSLKAANERLNWHQLGDG